MDTIKQRYLHFSQKRSTTHLGGFIVWHSIIFGQSRVASGKSLLLFQESQNLNARIPRKQLPTCWPWYSVIWLTHANRSDRISQFTQHLPTCQVRSFRIRFWEMVSGWCCYVAPSNCALWILVGDYKRLLEINKKWSLGGVASSQQLSIKQWWI